MICRKCSFNVNDGVATCPNCGSKLNDISSLNGNINQTVQNNNPLNKDTETNNNIVNNNNINATTVDNNIYLNNQSENTNIIKTIFNSNNNNAEAINKRLIEESQNDALLEAYIGKNVDKDIVSLINICKKKSESTIKIK